MTTCGNIGLLVRILESVSESLIHCRKFNGPLKRAYVMILPDCHKLIRSCEKGIVEYMYS